jgi:hypothetical protein
MRSCNLRFARTALPLLFLALFLHAGCTRSGPSETGASGASAPRVLIERTPCEPPEHWRDDEGKVESWKSELVFPTFDKRFLLGQSTVITSPDGATGRDGFDRDSFELNWLDPGRLLWAKWATVPQGSGGFHSQGTLILELTEAGVREVYRGFHNAFGRSGWQSWGKMELGVTYSRARHELIFTTTTTTFEANEERGGPLFVRELLSGHRRPRFVRRLVQREIRSYRLEDGALRFDGGYAALDLGEQTFLVSKVAAHQRMNPQRLRALNPRLHDAMHCSGQIVVDDRISPLVVETAEHAADLSGDRWETTHTLVSDGSFVRRVLRDAIPENARAAPPPRAYRVVHVFVSLCDNAHQGIQRVPAALGNGQEPRTNIYWGAQYGVKTFLDRSPHWEQMPVAASELRTMTARKAVLASCVFRSVGLEPPVYLVADAWDGRYAKECVVDFYGAASGVVPAGAAVDEPGNFLNIRAGRDADLVCFVGHNAFLDGEIDGFPLRALKPVPGGAVVLSCLSQRSFAGRLKLYGCEPLVTTTGTMAPEAYTLDAVVRAWAAGGSAEQMRYAAARAYARYQRCDLAAAERLFATGVR